MASIEQWLNEIRATHPQPGTTPTEHLEHTLSFYDDEPDDRIAVNATTNTYPEDECIRDGHTGLTFGDLRAILAQLEG